MSTPNRISLTQAPGVSSSSGLSTVSEDWRQDLSSPTHPGTPWPELPLHGAAPGSGGPPGYEVLEELGRGAMGAVYRARQTHLNRVVALKMILSGSHAPAEERLRFLAEAEAIAAVRHPGIVQVFDFGTHDGLPFFSMELCEGGSLAGKLADTPLPARQAAGLLEQVARAVQAAHEAGIVHRDLKPGNILLDAAGRPRVADFGLAKRVQGCPGLTTTGSVVGTPNYMAPEQALGKRGVGPAADVYALGAVLYHCLTGRPPFKAANVYDTLLQVVRDEPATPRQLNVQVPADLETVCLKCLHKEPARRYATAGDLADDLARWQGGEAILARPAGRMERAVKWASRQPALAALLAVSFFGVVGLALLSLVATCQWHKALDALQSEREAREQETTERGRRAVAQAETLLAAGPGQLPAILARLTDHRGAAVDRLRLVWDEPDSPSSRPRRMRAALALLPFEPRQVRADLAGWMLDVPDPAEFLVVRDALRPHAADLCAGLWQRLQHPQTPPARRLRILAALAAFDPDGPGWKQAAGQAVQPWLSEDPLFLGSWTNALRPARAWLRGPLSEVYLGKRLPGRREVAASILGDYEKDRPEKLSELAIEADDRQLAILLPVLRRHRGRIVELLSREVDRRLAPTWQDPPLNPSWPAPAVREQVEQAGGLLAERFALVQTLPLDQGRPLVASLARSGYRLACYRPYPLGRVVCVAAVWQRDGKEVILEQGLTAQALRARDAELRKEGLVPLDVAVYPDGQGGEDHHAALWVRKEAGTLDGQLHLGLTTAATPLQGLGYLPRTQTWTPPDGKPSRLAAVWWKPAQPPRDWLYHRNQEVSWYEANLSPGRLQQDVRLVPADPLAAARAWRDPVQRGLEEAQRALKGKPDDLAELFQRGMAYYWLGEPEKALADFDAFIKRTPRAERSHRFRALLHARAGRAELARADLATFLARSHFPDEDAVTKALVAVYLGQARQGLRELEADLARHANDGGWLFWAARVYAQAAEKARRQDDPAGVQEYADRAVELLRRGVAAGHATPGKAWADAELVPLHTHPGFQSLLREFRLDRHYSAVWHGCVDQASEEVHELTPAPHLERCRRLAARGYRPFVISAAEIGAGQQPLMVSVWRRPRVSAAAQTALAHRQAGAALPLLKLGEGERVWPLLKNGPYPEARSRLIGRLGSNGVGAGLLVDKLEQEKDVSIRRALILALGEYSAEQVPAPLRRRLVPNLLAWYRDDPDAGLHGAIDWLLRHDREGPAARPLAWGQAKALEQIDAEQAARVPARQAASLVGQVGWPGGGVTWLAAAGAWTRLDRPAAERGWYVNGQGQTLSQINAREPFLMGSPGDEAGHQSNELQHWRQIGRRYALATKPVTVDQFGRFLKAHPEVNHYRAPLLSPAANCPATHVSWYEAAQYCRWLSEQEGIPEHEMVYPSVAVIQKCKISKTPLRLPADHLKQCGYRLPTEAEWEYACRAGARTSRFFGTSPELLPRYAWYIVNAQERTWPVGQKRPNDLGLFDLHGNVFTWCQESHWRYPGGTFDKPAGDREDRRDVTLTLGRPRRAGGFSSHPIYLRSAFRSPLTPSVNHHSAGLRIARTLP